ncbi:glucose-6-phosphate isomerase [Helcococcus kunzii]|uniref:glucose-6-phosphate isomerase n=1 Tax=Helcococcus kunzii TaxID=40091 RepID=UPI001BAE94E2|nr:glucose-6-phosphate isomerase [Helcococcus kunzii]MCT1796308.1 glucose-6-phosphate isomerase [Helcococcus kunzii]MCT1988978.1 glucose-6-phosphate isomerase [Helcococcus kunzii]QUY64166.1 glucose-6-phosphate isomerase [Helcococcus kunzii]
MKIELQNAGVVDKLSDIKEELLKVEETLLEGKGEGNDFLGWIDLPINYDKDEFERIKKAAEKIRKDSDVLVAIGIGGSYLGAKAVINALSNSFSKSKPEVIFTGNHLSSTEIVELKEYLKDKDFSINVISKSGTTTEPAVAFRIFKELLEEKYSKEEAQGRIYATTDKEKGALKTLATNMGYETFVVPDNVGGRFSVLTAVGLLPIAVAGGDIEKLMQGAADYREEIFDKDFEENPVLQYAAARNLLNRDGKDIEILVTYEPKLSFFNEWWKQLAGESEGKDNKGLFPTSVVFTTDLHSLGQIIQQGKRNIFETVISVDSPKHDVDIKEDAENLDGLNYLVGKSVDEVNKVAMEATIEAHVAGNVPNILITMDKIDEYNLGKYIYFFEYAIGVSGYLLGVNPFNQPGVEDYKNNMFRMLEKPGY